MHEFNFLSGLFAYEPGELPVLSIYLNTEPNQTGRKDFRAFLKKQFADHIAVTEKSSEKRASLENDERKVMAFADELDPAVRGAAIFTSSGAGFFKTFEYSVPFNADKFFLFDRPRIFPLAELVDENPRFAAALVDTNAARIFIFNRGETVRQEEIQNTKTNRTEVGGWSQMRFQRHIENFHLQHAKEVAEELARIVRKDRIDRIVLAGDETVIIPLLRRHLVEEVDRCVLGVLPLNVHTPEHELFKRCESAVREFRENENRGRVEYLLEHNYTNGAGVAGVESTLRALLNGEVQELFISSDPASVNYNSKDIEQVFLDYGKVAKIPDLSDHTALIDEVLKYGVGSVERIRFVPNLDELKKVDGIGAILRFKASGATQ